MTSLTRSTQTGRPHARPTLVAIPGQSTRYKPPPPGAVEAARTALAALSDEIEAATLFGFAKPAPIISSYYAAQEQLSTTVTHAEAWFGDGNICRSIHWRWGVLRHWSDGWYDMGWHPDATFLGLTREWERMLRKALGGVQ